MVDSHRFLHSGGDSLASMGLGAGKQMVRPTVVDSLATQGGRNGKENSKKANKNVQFSEPISVLASATNVRRREKVPKVNGQGVRPKDKTSAYSLRSRISKKIARKPTTDGGVLAAFARASKRSQKARIETKSIAGEPVTKAKIGSPSQSQHRSLDVSLVHGPVDDRNSDRSVGVATSDGLANLFRNSLEISDKREITKTSQARKSKKVNVDKRPEKRSHSRGMGLISLMENLSISSSIPINRIRSTVAVKDISTKVFNVENDENRIISSPSPASAPKKQDRKKTPKKFSAPTLPKQVCSNSAIFPIKTTLSGTPQTECVLLKQEDGGSTANLEPVSHVLSEAEDQNEKQSEPSRRSQRSRKPTNFFQPTIEVAVSDGDICIRKGILNTDESTARIPMSVVDHNISEKAKHRRASVDDGLNFSSNGEILHENSISQEKVEKREKVAIAPAGCQNSHSITDGDSTSHIGRPQRVRRPTAFFKPSAKEQTGRDGSALKLPTDEGSVAVQTNKQNVLACSEDQTARTSKPASTSADVEKDSKQDEFPLQVEHVAKTTESSYARPGNNEKCSHLLNNEQTVCLKSKVDWSTQQLDQLKKAHRQSNPMSGTFWDQVAAAVDGKSPGQCRDQWYSLIKTPAVKSKGAQIPCIAKPSGEDDLFDSTPMRNMLDPTKMKTSLLNIYAGIQIANRKVPETNGEDMDPNTHFQGHFFQPKIGYKTYLQGMKRDISKEARNQKKGRKTGNTKSRSKALHSIAGSIKDSEVDMSARLTPGGSFRFQNRNIEDHENDDDWENQSSYDN